jgi:hypothetical protein
MLTRLTRSAAAMPCTLTHGFSVEITMMELTAQARKFADATFDPTPYLYAALI